MMTQEVKALDLDELFGQDKSVKVKWHDKNYDLLLVGAIGPKDALALQKMQARTAALGMASDEINDQDAEELERMFDEMLKILSNELPLKEIPFGAKMRILQFYTEQSQGKKKDDVLPKQTGETSSQV
jgi:hypothetical protein